MSDAEPIGWHEAEPHEKPGRINLTGDLAAGWQRAGWCGTPIHSPRRVRRRISPRDAGPTVTASGIGAGGRPPRVWDRVLELRNPVAVDPAQPAYTLPRPPGRRSRSTS
jgi:hypothetical protein